jgi:hypothetical protein
MQPDEEIDDTTVTMADFTTATSDDGGGNYEQYVGGDVPAGFNPFEDYPEQVTDEYLPALVPVPMAVTTVLAHNLDVRRQNVWSCWGHDVQVGWIGDAAHQSRCSDHNRDSVGVVHAIDVMVTGSRAAAVVKEALAHPGDLQYVIHNRTIWTVGNNWQPKAYTGSNPHTIEVHLSGKHGSAHESSGTCVGYDLTAQAATPVFNLCPKPVKPPVPKPPVPKPVHAPGTRVLKNANPDLTGADVVFVQQFIGKARCGPADGTYGAKTASGVRWYQAMRGIHVDGIVGPGTWGQMGVKWRG